MPPIRWRAPHDAFVLPAGIVYLDGNSLGALPKQAEERVRAVMTQQWGKDLIKSWNVHDWIGAPARIGAKIARLIGAKPNEVVVADSTSLNVFKALHAALCLRPERRVILSDDGNFPTDLYMAQGLTELLGATHRLKIVPPGEIASALTEDVAVLMLTEVDYRTGRLHDMAALTKAAHDKGALTLWDLAHSAGAFPVDLNGCDADFAVGCGYKYLNGGPGAPAFIYVAERWQGSAEQPLFGWMGHDAPFAFDLDYRPRARHRALPGRHAADAEPDRAGGRPRPVRRRRARRPCAASPARSATCSSPWWSRNWRAAASPSPPRAWRRSAVVRCPTGTRKDIPSCRR